MSWLGCRKSHPWCAIRCGWFGMGLTATGNPMELYSYLWSSLRFAWDSTWHFLRGTLWHFMRQYLAFFCNYFIWPCPWHEFCIYLDSPATLNFWVLSRKYFFEIKYCFSRMRSKGSRFTLGVWGLRVCSLDVAQPSATVRVRTVWPCLW